MERERITISIKKDVLDQIDKAIDGIDIRNRSHAFEYLALRALGKTETYSAVLILGGDDALENVPTALQYLKDLKKNGFDKVFIVVGFLGDKVKNRLDKYKNEIPSTIYSNKGEGSGGALKELRSDLNQPFFVINTSDYHTINLKDIFRFHTDHNSTATVATDDLSTLKGVYLLSPEIFDIIPEGYSMLEEDILPALSKSGKLIITPIID